MELEAAKMIGAGLAAIALAGAGVGIGIIFGNYLSGAMKIPQLRKNSFLIYFRFCTCRGYWIIWIGSCINHSFCVLNLMIKKYFFS